MTKDKSDEEMKRLHGSARALQTTQSQAPYKQVFGLRCDCQGGFRSGSVGKNLPAMQEMQEMWV